ncbi:hypothetical protein M427DRAFT_140667 [Gonapodya prolifera JEL478]|uniref:Uncharacterized protein n=1 Tax=Gonapodya prolifera (strain JEL478) TaxID=1344416 RepID=A0A138ZYP9_GONPJ|nr:hypothetical protein M427DRAFT_140667 [Gonapodya prolifera JEL478]|eukprot:KXS09601.1 hypothetical protein M427DRAFT_140667 [Gonapodya prolifera JEL478]
MSICNDCARRNARKELLKTQNLITGWCLSRAFRNNNPRSTFVQSDPFSHTWVTSCSNLRDDPNGFKEIFLPTEKLPSDFQTQESIPQHCLILPQEWNRTVMDERSSTKRKESALEFCFALRPEIVSSLSELPSFDPHILVGTFPAVAQYFETLWEVAKPGGWGHMCKGEEGAAHALHNYVSHFSLSSFPSLSSGSLVTFKSPDSPLNLTSPPPLPLLLLVPPPLVGPLVSFQYTPTRVVKKSMGDDGTVLRPPVEDLVSSLIGTTVEVVGGYNAHSDLRKSADVWYGMHSGV